MAAETAAPAFVAVFGADAAGGDEFEVAGGADGGGVVVALGAVEAGGRGLNGVSAEGTGS